MNLGGDPNDLDLPKILIIENNEQIDIPKNRRQFMD